MNTPTLTMNTPTTDASLELYKGDKFGGLIKLPNLYTEASNRLLNATNSANKFLELYKVDNWEIADIDKIETEWIPNIQKLRTKMSDAFKATFDGRSPYSKLFTDIVTSFTTIEKALQALEAKFAAIENAKEAEKLRRANKVKADAKKKTDDANARVERIKALTVSANSQLGTIMRAGIEKMTQRFFDAITGEAVDAVLLELREWKDKGINFTMSRIALTGNKDEVDEVIAANTVAFQAEYRQLLGKSVQSLVDMGPGRKEQLIAPSDVCAIVTSESFVDKMNASVSASVDTKNEAASTEADRDIMNNGFDASVAVASANTTPAKGTRIKNKYVAKTHKAHQAIMQSWVTHNFPLLSIDELDKKLSFMRTAANDRLNDGALLEADGLTVVEDVRTSTSRTPKQKTDEQA